MVESEAVYVYTGGFNESKVDVNRSKLVDSEAVLERVREYRVTLGHADMLNRNLKNRRVVVLK